MTKLKYDFAIPNDLMDPGNENQWPLKSQKDNQDDIRCLLMEDDSTTYPAVLLKTKSENKIPRNKFN